MARLDGATRFQQFRHVTLPSIRPTLVFLLLMIAIWSALVFDYIYLTTGGGPANSSEVLGTHLYKTAFERFQTSYAASIGLVMVIWVALVVGGFVYLRKRGLGDMSVTSTKIAEVSKGRRRLDLSLAPNYLVLIVLLLSLPCPSTNWSSIRSNPA